MPPPSIVINWGIHHPIISYLDYSNNVKLTNLPSSLTNIQSLLQLLPFCEKLIWCYLSHYINDHLLFLWIITNSLVENTRFFITHPSWNPSVISAIPPTTPSHTSISWTISSSHTKYFLLVPEASHWKSLHVLFSVPGSLVLIVLTCHFLFSSWKFICYVFFLRKPFQLPLDSSQMTFYVHLAIA